MRAPRVLGGTIRRPQVAAAVLLALAAVLAACQEGDSEPPLPPLTPFDAALTERLHEIRDRAVEVRGLTAYKGIEEGWFDRDFVRDWTNGPLLVREDTGFFLTGASLGFSDSRFSTSFSPARFLNRSLVSVILLEIIPY